MDTILDIKNLTIKFGSFTAVDNISFSVGKGEIFGFLGANGAGKTTVIRAICGLTNITSGAIFINGANISSRLSFIKPHIGYMSQKFTLYKDLTIKENILFSAALYSMDSRQGIKRMNELFEYTNFKENENEFVKNLSGGSKQVVSLCACLLHNPDIIFLDEPTAGISPASRVLFWNLIRKLSGDGKTVFATTHYMDEARYCFQIALMRAGKIIALDSPENLKRITACDNLDDVFIKIISETKGNYES
ncbi:MAG: ABC transporter ATP-binding protein [Elusimicrobiota bacterium]|jgi:ABC-2 type transport system ATP-binding protein|nr:ABC transporter ATP-binding protein [Elusimicrobiota bacterium]